MHSITLLVHQCVSPCSHGQCAQPQPCPASSCTTPAGVLAWGSSGPLDGSERCNHPLHWVDRPRYDPLYTWTERHAAVSVEAIVKTLADFLLYPPASKDRNSALTPAS